MSGSSPDTRAYWEKRLSTRLDLRGTGHRAFDINYNLWLYQAQFDTIIALLREFNVDLTDRSVLDAGSGTGFFVRLYAEQSAAPIMGIDITEASTQYLQQTFTESVFLTGDISAPNLPIDREFHLVSAISVLYHILDEQGFTQALSNLCRHVTAGGYLVISDTFSRPLLPTAHHARFRTINHYRVILDQHQFQLLHIAPIYYLLNHSFVPFLGPKLINAFQLGHTFYKLDRWLNQQQIGNGNGMKIMLARRRPDSP